MKSYYRFLRFYPRFLSCTRALSFYFCVCVGIGTTLGILFDYSAPLNAQEAATPEAETEAEITTKPAMEPATSPSETSASEPTAPSVETSAADLVSDFTAEPVKLNESLFLVAPHDNSVVVVSRLWLILKGELPEEPVTMNGQPFTWDKHFGGDVHVGILRLEIGMQNLKIGDDELHFVLGRNEKDHAGPEDWQVYRLHNMKPGPNPCIECHNGEKDEEEKFHVGTLKTPDEACFKCHQTDKIQTQHENTRLDSNWTQSCRDCHFIHASPYKYLLRQPQETYLK